MEGKICTKCGEWKPLDEFKIDKRIKSGRVAQCKKCENERYNKWKETNKKHLKEYHKQWREENKEKLDTKRKEYYQNNKEEISKKNKERYIKNRDKDEFQKKRKEYREMNKDKKREYDKQYIEKNREEIKIKRKIYTAKTKERKQEYDKHRTEEIKREELDKIKELLEKMHPELKKLPGYGVIYKITNIKTKRVYIGQTIVSLKRRYGANVIQSWIKERMEKENQKFKEELIEEDFTIDVIDVGCCQYHLDKLEAHYIDKYNSCEKGYNNKPGNYKSNDGICEFEEILRNNNLNFIDGELRKNG